MDDLSRVRRLAAQGVEAGLAEVAHAVLEVAKRNVPVGDPAEDPDPGVSLRESGHVERELGGRFVRIVFDTPYAAKQHEDQRLKHPRGGGPKYLERAVLAAVPHVEKAIAGEVRKRMTGTR